MGSLTYWCQPGFAQAINDYLTWLLEESGTLEDLQKIMDWQHQLSASLFKQILEGKKSDEEARISFYYDLLNRVAKETERAQRRKSEEVSKGYFAAMVEHGPLNQLTVSKRDVEIRKTKVQLELECSSAWRTAIAANIVGG
ncbi:MAG: hypothetical protein ACRD9S_06265 [Pyrinomonadaceae bacterium]